MAKIPLSPGLKQQGGKNLKKPMPGYDNVKGYPSHRAPGFPTDAPGAGFGSTAPNSERKPFKV